MKAVRNRRGQTTVEYIMIIAVIVVAVMLLGKGIREQLPQLIGNVFKGVNSKVQSLMESAGGN